MRPKEIGTWDEEGEGEGVEKGVRDNETKDDNIGDEDGEIEEEDNGIVDQDVEGEEISSRE